MDKPPLVVAGIDVGGKKKGLHAVALTDGAYHSQFHSCDTTQIVDWCRATVRASVIAIDAPCRWSADGRSRPAERQLMGEKIMCFSTPSREKAIIHRTNHYGWMLQGEELFRALETTHPLCCALPLIPDTNVCLETFPHAITHALGIPPIFGRNKRRDRTALLLQARIDTTKLTNIDWIDATLCALTAHRAASGTPCKAYGEPETGLLIVPMKR